MNLSDIISLYDDQPACAQLVSLSYRTDSEPGIKRKRKGNGFSYQKNDGSTVSQKRREWIESLAIPPAWEEVWISPSRSSHLLATGFDSKNRKQYIYHPKWNQVRKLLNFYRLLPFGRSLPSIRKEINERLKKDTLDYEMVVATVIKLLDQTFIRIGNEVYTKANDTYGLTTLKNEHVTVKKNGRQVNFSFTGKSHKDQDITINHQTLADILRRLQHVPGEKLFQYYDHNKNLRPVTADDINSYLKELVYHDFSAKDFRTWGGTLTAFSHLKKQLENAKDRATTLKEALEKAADKLGNTVSVCKAHYIHPHLIGTWEEERLNKYLPQRSLKTKRYLSQSERELLYFLESLFQEEASDLLSSS